MQVFFMLRLFYSRCTTSLAQIKIKKEPCELLFIMAYMEDRCGKRLRNNTKRRWKYETYLHDDKTNT